MSLKNNSLTISKLQTAFFYHKKNLYELQAVEYDKSEENVM